MANKILCIIAILMCLSCSSGWDSSEGRAYKDSFMNTCMMGDYNMQYSCQCVLDKLMAKYSGPQDDVNGQMRDAYNFGLQCY